MIVPVIPAVSALMAALIVSTIHLETFDAMRLELRSLVPLSLPACA